MDLVVTCIHHPVAGNRILLALDNDLSTTNLLRRTAMGMPSHLVPVPASVRAFETTILGKPELAQRLCGLETKDLLSWRPMISADEVLIKKATKGYLSEAPI